MKSRYEHRWNGPDGTLFQAWVLAEEANVIRILFTAYPSIHGGPYLEYCVSAKSDVSTIVLDALVESVRNWFELTYYHGNLHQLPRRPEGEDVRDNVLYRIDVAAME